jgi:hypothetical protein
VVGLVKTEIGQIEDKTQQLSNEILTTHYNTPKRAFDSLTTDDTSHNCNDESNLTILFSLLAPSDSLSNRYLRASHSATLGLD